MIGGVLLVIAPFLPWLSVSGTIFLGEVDLNAFQLGDIAHGSSFTWDGVELVALGVLTLGVGVIRLTTVALPKAILHGTVLLGLLAGSICINRYRLMNHAVDVVNTKYAFVSSLIESGLYVAIFGSVGAILAGLIVRRRTN